MVNFASTVPGVYFHGDWSKPSPRLVFVHGFGVDQDFFNAQGAALSPFADWSASIPLLTFDLAAHGRAPGLRNEHGQPTMSAQALAADAASRITTALATIDTSSTPLILFGHSLGGTVCMYMADLLPNVIEIVLADPFLVVDLRQISQQAVQRDSMILAQQNADPEIIFALIRDVFGNFEPDSLPFDSTNPHLAQLCSVANRLPVTLGRGLRNQPGQFHYGEFAERTIGECGALLSESDYAKLGKIVDTLYLSPDPAIGHLAMVFDKIECWIDCLKTQKR